MVLQHGGIAQRAQGPAKDGGVLLDDAGERNHEDHSAQAMAYGVVQREGQRRQRLAPTRGHRQGKQPRRQFRLRTHMLQDV